MKIRSLRTRFIVSGALLLAVTVASGIWSVRTFDRLGAALVGALDENQTTIDLAVELIYALEREDDALLQVLVGNAPQAADELRAARSRFEELYADLGSHLRSSSDQDAYSALRVDTDAYRKVGDALVGAAAAKPTAIDKEYEGANAALRQAVADCRHFRAKNVEAMREEGVAVRHDADHSSLVVAGLTFSAFLLSAAIVAVLTRSVLSPVGELDRAFDAIRHDDLTRRVPVRSSDELGRLAQGFNRMAEALGEYRREADDRFRQLAENIHEIFWVFDVRRDRVSYISPAYEEVWGRTRESVYENPQSWLESIYPDDREVVVDNIQRQLQGAFAALEFRIVRSDGSVRWIRSRAFPTNDADGSPLRISGLAEDITERKRADQEVRYAKDRLELAVRGSNMAIWEFEMQDGSLENSTPVFINIWESLGYDPGEAPADFATVFDLAVHPEDQERVQRETQSFLASDRHEFESEHRSRHKDGSIHWRLSRGVAVRGADGRPRRFIGTVVDITELKRAEAALRESEHRFRTFADHATDAFFLQDENFEILDVNRQACHTLGRSREELLGMTPLDFDPDLTPELLEISNRKLNDGEVVEFASRHVRKNGTDFPVEIRAQAFWEGGRRFTVALARDITERSRSQAALRESEERFRSTFDNAGVGIALCDIEGNFVRVNQMFADIVGYSAEELVGRSYRDITHPDDMWIDVNQIGQILRGEVPTYSIEKRYVVKNGSHAWVDLSASVLQRDAEGQPVSLIAIIQDISERKRLAADLNSSKERLELAVRGSNLTIWELEMPDGVVENGRPIHINGWEPLGYDPSEARGDFASMYAKLVDPAEHPRVSRAIDDCLSGRTKDYEVEYRVRHKNGDYRWHLARGVALRDPNGPQVRFIGSTVDVTDLKRAEAALRESEERFRGTFENAAVGIGHVDSNGRWMRVNQRLCEIVGYSRDELLTKTFQEITYVEDLAGSIEPFTALWQGKLPSYSLEKRYVRKDRSLIWIETTVSVQLNVEREPIYTIAFIQDISQRRRLELELRHAKDVAESANRAKDEFLANVSHEIRTPMNAILGMTELVLDSPLPDGQRECLATVKSAADNLLNIINDLLDFSRIEAGKLDLDPAAFSLRRTLGDTLRSLAVRAHRKGLELVSQVQPDVPDALIGDAGRLRQVLINLIGNAIKFTAEGEVVVSVESASFDAAAEECVVRFSVRDTGIGIPLEKQESIFRAFEQEDTSTTRKYGGTGLGLAISTRLVQMMSGTLNVESEPGHGATFAFTARFERQTDPSEESVPQTPVLLRNLRVLIVDDNATNRHLLEEWLRNWNMEPASVGDGVAALDALWDAVSTGNPYSLVMLDARMPDTDGFVLASSIRRRTELAATRIILLTSGDRPSEWELTRQLRIDAHLLKPVQQNELLEVIYRVMSSAPHDVAPTGKPKLISESANAPGEMPLRVLVAEDNELNAQLLELLLGKKGHEARLVNNGREALELAVEGNVDLLLLDIHMPELDGFQVVKAIRSHEEKAGGHLPIIALTARSRSEDRERCLAAGMDAFLIKPFAAAELWTAIRQVVPPTLHSEGGHAGSLDPHALLAACGGDADILREICSAFRTHLPDQIATLQDALRNGDVQALREGAHKVSGVIAAFSSVAGAVASKLEDAAGTGNLESCPSLVDQLAMYVNELSEEVGALTIESLQRLAPDAGKDS